MGRKLKFGEPTKVFRVRLPISKYDEIKEKIENLIKTYIGNNPFITMIEVNDNKIEQIIENGVKKSSEKANTKSIREIIKDWREKWIKENIPEGVKYNPILHKRIPAVPKLTKLIRYAEKLIKDGLDNRTINERLLKYRNIQLPNSDLTIIRLEYEVEKIEDNAKVEIQIEALEKNINELIEKKHRIHNDYMYNIQSPYLKIERQMVKDNKHKYPKYIELMKEKNEYMFKDGYVFRGNGEKMTSAEFSYYMNNIQSPYLKIEKRMVKEHYQEYPKYLEFMRKKAKYLDNMTEIGKAIKNNEKMIKEIEDNSYRKIKDKQKQIVFNLRFRNPNKHYYDIYEKFTFPSFWSDLNNLKGEIPKVEWKKIVKINNYHSTTTKDLDEVGYWKVDWEYENWKKLKNQIQIQKNEMK